MDALAGERLIKLGQKSDHKPTLANKSNDLAQYMQMALAQKRKFEDDFGNTPMPDDFAEGAMTQEKK